MLKRFKEQLTTVFQYILGFVCTYRQLRQFLQKMYIAHTHTHTHTHTSNSLMVLLCHRLKNLATNGAKNYIQTDPVI